MYWCNNEKILSKQNCTSNESNFNVNHKYVRHGVKYSFRDGSRWIIFICIEQHVLETFKYIELTAMCGNMITRHSWFRSLTCYKVSNRTTFDHFISEKVIVQRNSLLESLNRRMLGNFGHFSHWTGWIYMYEDFILRHILIP